jgi:flagellar basal-body rod protein FlgF
MDRSCKLSAIVCSLGACTIHDMDGIELMGGAMHAAKARLDVCAANLANVSTDGFRRSVAHSALTESGIASWTTVDASRGSLRRTGRAFDLAVAGEGAFVVRDGSGRLIRERSISFERDRAGHLVDDRKRLLMGMRCPLVAGADVAIDDRGVAREAGRVLDRVRVLPGTVVQSGFLESADVDAIHEMVDVLEAQRAFETAQKTLSAIDDVRAKTTSEISRVKS